MVKQGRPAWQPTPIIVQKRVPIIRISDFCHKYGSDIIELLADDDNKPQESIHISKDLAAWMKSLNHHKIPVYCHNRYHKKVLNSFYGQYRKQGKGKNLKSIEITCFPRNLYYSSYQCWYIHANKNQKIPDFCESCRQRLDQHLGKNFQTHKSPSDMHGHPNTQNIGSQIENDNPLNERIRKTSVKFEEPENTEKILDQVKIQQSHPEEKSVPQQPKAQNKQLQQKSAFFSIQNIQVNQIAPKKKSIRKKKSIKRGVEIMEVIPEVKNEENYSMSL